MIQSIMSKILVTITALLESQQQPKNFLPFFVLSASFISQSSIRGVASAIIVHVEDNLGFDTIRASFGNHQHNSACQFNDTNYTCKRFVLCTCC